MIITWQGADNFQIKSKNKNVKIGEVIALGDLKIDSPGEYESGGVQVEVVDGTIEIFSEKMTIAWIKKAKILNDSELERLNGIDVLLIGIGGGDYTETKTAIEVIGQIESKVVIPVSADTDAGKESLENFSKTEGATSEPVEQYKFSFNELPIDERRTVILKPSV